METLLTCILALELFVGRDYPSSASLQVCTPSNLHAEPCSEKNEAMNEDVPPWRKILFGSVSSFTYPENTLSWLFSTSMPQGECQMDLNQRWEAVDKARTSSWVDKISG